MLANIINPVNRPSVNLNIKWRRAEGSSQAAPTVLTAVGAAAGVRVLDRDPDEVTSIHVQDLDRFRLMSVQARAREKLPLHAKAMTSRNREQSGFERLVSTSWIGKDLEIETHENFG